MRFFRRTIQFIVDCFEALTEDDTAAERRAHQARLAQQRWHEFLSAETRPPAKTSSMASAEQKWG